MFLDGQPTLVLAGIAIFAIGLSLIPRRQAYDPIKRILDLILATPALIVLSPIIVTAAVAIKLDSKGSAFYAADRIGAKRRHIKVWKLRTMVADADRSGKITSGDDPRITRVGRLLRATKIDELPQLFNIVSGTMTIVGPRPESTNIVEQYYTSQDSALLESRPGLTCPGTLYYYIHDENNRPPENMSVEQYYAQVSLRTKLEADLYYVQHRCLVYDIKLIALTVLIISFKLLGKNPPASSWSW